jgi:hypothetical protein
VSYAKDIEIKQKIRKEKEKKSEKNKGSGESFRPGLKSSPRPIPGQNSKGYAGHPPLSLTPSPTCRIVPFPGQEVLGEHGSPRSPLIALAAEP